MTLYAFDGIANVTVADFELAVDGINFGVSATDISSVSDTAVGVVVTTTSGTSLTLSGLTLADLSATPLGSLPEAFLVVGDDAGSYLFGGEAGSVIYGNAGKDAIDGSASGDVIFGGEGNDTITGAGGSDRLYGGQGNDTVFFGEEPAFTILGVVEEDLLLVGGLGRDEITGLVTGSAVIYGGSETTAAGDGADAILVTMREGSTVQIYADAGNDVIQVEGYEDGISGSVSIDAGAGNDTVAGSFGGDTTIIGGLGADIVDVEAVGFVAIAGGSSLSDKADGADYIDVFLSAASSDAVPQAYILGNAGNDRIEFETDAGSAVAYIHGGSGFDAIYASGLGVGSQINGGIGTDTIQAEIVDGTVTVFGGNGMSSADDGTDVIMLQVAEGATASVFGNGGDDMIQVYGIGDVVIHGGKGADVMFAAGPGKHTMTGGMGADTFAFYSEQPTEATLATITDLNFDEDFVVSDALFDALIQVSGSADSFDDLVTLGTIDQFDGNAAALVSVDAGAYVGDYLAYESDGGLQIVEVTGYTGTVDVDIFVGQSGFLIG